MSFLLWPRSWPGGGRILDLLGAAAASHDLGLARPADLAVMAGFPFHAAGVRAFPRGVEAEVHLALGLRTPVIDAAEVVEFSLETGSQEGLETAEQVAASFAGASPRIREQRLVHVKAPVVVHHAVEQLGSLHRVRLHDGRDEIVFRVIEYFDLVAELSKQIRKWPRGVHRPVGEVGLPVPGHLIGFLQRLPGFVFETDDELRLDDDAGVTQQLNGLLVLRDRGLLVEAVEFQLRRRLGAERNMDQAGLAIERQERLVAQDVSDAGIDTPQDFQVAADQFLAECHELLLVDGRLFVCQNEKADIVIADQLLNLVDHALRIANSVVAPEFPLRTEAASEGAAARHVGNGHALAHRDVNILAPLEHAPVRRDRVEILYRRCRRRRDDLFALAECNAPDVAPGFDPVSAGQRAEQVHEDFLALAPHDGVDPRRFGQNLLVHEGSVDAAQYRQRRGADLFGDLQQPFGLVDRRCDRRCANDVWLFLAQDLAYLLVGKVVGHGVDKANVAEPGLP